MAVPAWISTRTLLLPWLRGVGIFSVALGLGLLVSFWSERAGSQTEVVRGVVFRGRALSGLDEADLSSLWQAENARLNAAEFQLGLNGAVHGFRAARLGLRVDDEGMTRHALSLGRTGGFSTQLGFWLMRLVSTAELPLRVRLDEGRLREALSPLARRVLPEPSEPFVSYHKKLVFELGRAGKVVDYEALRVAIESAALRGERGPLQVPVVARDPLVDPARLEKVRQSATRLLASEVSFRVPPRPNDVQSDQENTDVAPDPERGDGAGLEFSLTGRQLGAALSSTYVEESHDLRLELSAKILRHLMRKHLAQVEVPARDARFEFLPRGGVQLVPGRTGWRLADERLGERIVAAVDSGKAVVDLPFVQQPPKLSTQEAEALNVRGLVASFTTMHPCCQPRVENIHVAADRINQVVLRPGDRFSLNDRLGPRVASSGYRSAPAIVHGDMEEVLGGGISQLATTLFNAALRGGYEIVQRQPHSIYFSRYPEGHEATVSYPLPDLIFVNDSKSGLVIATHYTGTFIKVSLYGDNGGRKVRVSKSKRYDIVQPETEYEGNPDTPPDEPKRLRAGQLGWTVLVTREIDFADGRKKKESREVKYNARAALMRVHPCKIPEGSDGHTGETCPEPVREEREEVLSEDVYYETTNWDVMDEGG